MVSSFGYKPIILENMHNIPHEQVFIDNIVLDGFGSSEILVFSFIGFDSWYLIMVAR